MGDYFQFKIGRFQCTALNDGDFVGTASMLFQTAPQDELPVVLQLYGEQADHLHSPLTCLLVETGQEKILLDCGAGSGMPIGGQLFDNLAKAGFSAEDIDRVVLTHVHSDHALGAVDEEGRPKFPNARYVISKAEYEFWTDDEQLKDAPQWVVETAQRVLPGLKNQVHLIDGRGEVVPGIELLPAYGHTEGHCVVQISDGEEHLLFLSDLALHPIHLRYPQWTGQVDQYPKQAVRTRREMFSYAEQTGALVLLYHFNPFPSLGRIVKDGESWGWQPAEM